MKINRLPLESGGRLGGGEKKLTPIPKYRDDPSLKIEGLRWFDEYRQKEQLRMSDDLEKSTGEFSVHYSHKPIKEIARKLRADQTISEAMLWGALRNRQLNGLKFLRQHPVGPTIVDFYCHELRLAIEIDGEIHLKPEQREHDKVRQEYIEAHDIRFMRFTADEVENNLTDVIQRIAVII